MTTTELDDDAFRHLVQRIDPHSRLVRAWRLTGGVSAQITALEVERDGQVSKWVVRLHGERDRSGNPDIARDEFRLLEVVRSYGVAGPAPVYVDTSCELFPTPVVVIEFIDGETLFDVPDTEGYVVQMAEQLAVIHSVADSPEISFLPRRDKGYGARPAIIDDSLNEGRIRDALESIVSVTQANNSVLLHGDYWPGNLLWNNDTLAAVIDWEDAGIGEPLVDLGNTRLEVLFAYGAEAMRTFTDHYLSLTRIDTTNLPYWDLCAALRLCSEMDTWGLDETTLARMKAQHAVFVEQALHDIEYDAKGMVDGTQIPCD